MKHLVVISLGPVQDFIASARRTRDLWFGSWVLSEVSKAAASTLPFAGLIFPCPKAPEDLYPETPFSVANKLMAEVEGKPVEIAGKAYQAAQGQLMKLFDEALGRDQTDRWVDVETARRQVRDLLEFNWVAVPRSDNYKADRERAESLLASRKTTRSFSPVSWGSERPKSSLDGAREAVTEQLERRPWLMAKAGLRAGEKLCGVGLLKRLGGRPDPKSGNRFRDRFFSTSHVAAQPLIMRLNASREDSLKAAFHAYCDLLLAPAPDYGWQLEVDDLGKTPITRHPLSEGVFGRADGRILYEDRLDELYDLWPLHEELPADEQEKRAELKRRQMVKNTRVKEARQRLRGFLEAFGKSALVPLPYYALFLGDGDRMGEVIDHNSQNPEQHRDLSKALSGFADQVEQIVEEEFGGSLVYSGGDDVLAFLPLHTALECCARLAAQFARGLEGFKNEDGLSPTLSGGLVIVHHLEPLEDALRLVRAAEREAKGVDGKNGLAVVLSKRSGADTTVVGKFETLVERLQNLARLHFEKAIPDGLAYKLRGLNLNLQGGAVPEAAIICEAERLIQGRDSARKAAKDKLAAYLRELPKHASSVGKFADELIVARIFTQAMEQADAKDATP